MSSRDVTIVCPRPNAHPRTHDTNSEAAQVADWYTWWHQSDKVQSTVGTWWSFSLAQPEQHTHTHTHTHTQIKASSSFALVSIDTQLAHSVELPNVKKLTWMYKLSWPISRQHPWTAKCQETDMDVQVVVAYFQAAPLHLSQVRTKGVHCLHRQSPDHCVPLLKHRTPTLLSSSKQVTILTELFIPVSDQWLPGSNFCRVTTNNEWGLLSQLGWILGQNNETWQSFLLPNPYPLWIWHCLCFIGRYLFVLQNVFRTGMARNGRTGKRERKERRKIEER
jgi:hypothetical protein